MWLHQATVKGRTSPSRGVMSKGPSAPSAPWFDEEDGGVYRFVLRGTADNLARELEKRAKLLREDSVTVDEVVMEIRKAVAGCAVDGHVIRAADLTEVLLELVHTYEHRSS